MNHIAGPKINDSRPYSQAVEYAGLIYTSGHIDESALGAEPPAQRDIATQTRAALDNLRTTLEASGSSLSHILRITCYLSDMKDFAGFNEVYINTFDGHKPARVTVGASLGRGLLVEVEAIAVVAKQ